MRPTRCWPTRRTARSTTLWGRIGSRAPPEAVRALGGEAPATSISRMKTWETCSPARLPRAGEPAASPASSTASQLQNYQARLEKAGLALSGLILQIALWGSINTSIFRQSAGKFLCCSLAVLHRLNVQQFLVKKFVVSNGFLHVIYRFSWGFTC